MKQESINSYLNPFRLKQTFLVKFSCYDIFLSLDIVVVEFSDRFGADMWGFVFTVYLGGRLSEG